jgi:MFS transporter, DHA2 family, multidrug resistance protein
MTSALSYADTSWKPRFNPWIIALTVTLATFMEVLDTSIANVALRHIAGGFSAGQDESTWVLTSYLVSNAIVLPMSGWLTTVIGRKRFYMTCVAPFTVSSILCGLAPSLPLLIFFRILQGAGGGGMGPSEQAILADTFPPEKRGQAFAVFGMAVVVAPAIGPTLGGWITDNYDWRWIFFINVPVGLLSLFLTSQVVEDPPWLRGNRGKGIKIDYIGLSLIVVGLGLLQIVLDKGQQEDWFGSTYITVFLIAAMTALVALVIHEWRHPHPILELKLLKNRNFAATVLFNFVLGSVLFGSTVLIPLFVQSLMGYTAQQAGEVLSPAGFMLMLLFPVAGLLSTKIDPRWMISFGFAMTAAGLYHLTHLSLEVGFGTLIFWRMYQMSGLAFIFIPISILSYVGIPGEKNNQVSGISNFIRNLGGSVGISMLTTFLARQSQVHQTNLVAHATTANPQFNNMLHGSTASMAKSGSGPAIALQQGYNQVMGLIQQQAALLSYVNAFWAVSIIVACLIPLPFLLKKPKRGEAQPVGGH